MTRRESSIDSEMLLADLRAMTSLAPDDPARTQLRNDLILAFKPGVERLVRAFCQTMTSHYDDLLQTGMIALIKAVDGWNPALAAGGFAPYLIRMVHGELCHYLRDHTWFVRVPRGVQETVLTINAVTNPLAQILGHWPRPHELAQHLALDTAEVACALRARASRNVGALDGGGADPRMSLELASLLLEREEGFARVEAEQTVHTLLNALSERDRAVVSLRFLADLPLAQVARRLGISPVHASRLSGQVIAVLRAVMADA